MSEAEKNPVLVLQMRRLGDVILTFPLLSELRRIYSGHPVWVVSEPFFFKPLVPFSPMATYFPPAALPALAKKEFELLINLGGSGKADSYAGVIRAKKKLGRINHNGTARVNGFWNLYRESLTLNNRHNIFHWADLFCMDMGSPPKIDPISPIRPAGTGRVGLFTGASEPAKRPDTKFWSVLAKRLARSGNKPVLLGGPAEKELGAGIMALGTPAINFCGRTNLAQLAALLKTLDLLITPDTGPMHLANWLSVPVLNLSLGNVNAAETGPFWPGQHIVRARMSCVGCWKCHRGKLACRDAMSPSIIASMANDIMAGKPSAHAPGLSLIRTGKDERGFFTLVDEQATTRNCLDAFWKDAFLFFNDPAMKSSFEKQAGRLKTCSPHVAKSMRKSMEKFFAIISRSRRTGQPPNDDFWKCWPLHSRLFAGHAQMFLQNDDFSNAAHAAVLDRLDNLLAALSLP